MANVEGQMPTEEESIPALAFNPTFALGQKMAWQNGDAALPGGFSNAKAV